MSSIGGILSSAARALVTHQKALSVTAHNISNAQTEGYSRQRAVLGASDPLITPDGLLGTGVELKEVDRVRDPLLDAIYRREVSAGSYHGEQASELAGIEKIFAEPSETGLMSTLDAFWNSWSDLAANPLSDAARAVVRQRAIQLGERFQQVVSGLNEQQAAGTERLQQFLNRTGELARHVGQLNGRIVAAEAGGAEAGDLRDARDLALDELSTLIGIQVVERDNGGVGVFVGGQALVDGTTTRELEIRGSGTDIGIVGAANPIKDPSGKIGGLLDILGGELAATKAEMNTFAQALVTKVNEIHQTGTAPTGRHTANFFESTLDGGAPVLTAEILDDAQNIAAGEATVAGTWEGGRTEVARALEKLRDADAGIAGISGAFGDHYGTMVTSVGSKVAGAENSADVHDTLARRADSRRDEVSGVSIDEELTHMIHQQAAYGAAARVVTRVDEMLQTLLGIV